jgi:hypothetical protein
MNHRIIRRVFVYFFMTGMLFLTVRLDLCAQEMPPRPIAASFIQNLGFGAFSPGLSGGSVIITSNGVRFATGSVVLVGQGYLYFPAIFGIEGNPGTILHLLNGPDETLVGSNGGSMILHLGEATPGDPIIINVAPPGVLQIRLGGTLTVGNPLSNPAGFYSGMFSLMFIQE